MIDFLKYLPISLLVVFLQVNAVQADSVRIERPAQKSDSDLCCSAGKAVFTIAPVSDERLNLSIVDAFRRWKERYIRPVFCPVDICHGSCRDYDDACLLAGSQPVLSYVANLHGIALSNFVLQGCGGSCSQNAGQLDLKLNSKESPTESGNKCCH